MSVKAANGGGTSTAVTSAATATVVNPPTLAGGACGGWASKTFADGCAFAPTVNNYTIQHSRTFSPVHSPARAGRLGETWAATRAAKTQTVIRRGRWRPSTIRSALVARRRIAGLAILAVRRIQPFPRITPTAILAVASRPVTIRSYATARLRRRSTSARLTFPGRVTPTASAWGSPWYWFDRALRRS